MAPKRGHKNAHAIVRAVMKQRGVTYRELAVRIGEPNTEKLSVAVRCTSGFGPKTIELRRRIAEALDLIPEDVWEKAHLEPRPTKDTIGYSKVVGRSRLTEEEWKGLRSSEKIRSILSDMDMTFRTYAEFLKVPYSSMTNAVYGNSNNEMRRRIADDLKVSVEEIWPELYTLVKNKVPLAEALSSEGGAGLRAFFGFGDLRNCAKIAPAAGTAEQAR